MMAASGQVIAHRSRRANTQAQLFEMGSEKVEALVASSNAMARHMLASSTPASAAAAWEAWARLLTAGMAPFHARARRNARSGRKTKGNW
jgi:phosphoribosylformylglycinamidine (FGAM) synthase-like enzyme